MCNKDESNFSAEYLSTDELICMLEMTKMDLFDLLFITGLSPDEYERCEKRFQTAESKLQRIRAALQSILDNTRDLHCGKLPLPGYGDLFWWDLVDTSPSLGLVRPEDFNLYWHLNGCFPHDMEYSDMIQLEKWLKRALEEAEAGETENSDEYFRYHCDQMREQIEQIQTMQLYRIRDDDDGVRMDMEEA